MDAAIVLIIIGVSALIVIFGDRMLDSYLNNVRSRPLPYQWDETDTLPRMRKALGNNVAPYEPKPMTPPLVMPPNLDPDGRDPHDPVAW